MLTTVIESTPICETKIENSGQKDLRDVKADHVCVALYQPLMHLGYLCASSKAKERHEVIKVYISYVFGIAYIHLVFSIHFGVLIKPRLCVVVV